MAKRQRFVAWLVALIVVTGAVGRADEVEYTLDDSIVWPTVVHGLSHSRRPLLQDPGESVRSGWNSSLFAWHQKSPLGATVWQKVASDHRNFYGRESLAQLGLGIGIGALMSNTGADRDLHAKFQSSVRSANSDDWFEFLHANKELGNLQYVGPVLGAAYLGGRLLNEVPLGAASAEWSERSFRAYLVGLPPMLAGQVLTGASRPGEQPYASDWRPLSDSNGVSGHSFVSAVPFISAAKMSEGPWLKATFYAASVLGPLSRVNDNAHYPSQALLGWWFAYVAVSAVDQTYQQSRNWNIIPYSGPDQAGVAFEYRW